MARSAADLAPIAPTRQPLSFFGWMGIAFALAAIIGFTPNSIAILVGEKANPPLLIHFHAAAMSAWMGLLATQACLMGMGHDALHKRLGMASLIIAPIVLGLMIVIAWPSLVAGLSKPVPFLIQTKRLLVFSVAIGLAILWRSKHPEAHKRLMFLGTFAVLDAAFFRMGWFLPNFGYPNWIAVAHAYQLLLLAPFLIYDIRQLGRIHPTFSVGIPVIIGFEVSAAVLA